MSYVCVSRHDWYQTAGAVTVTVMAKKQSEDTVTITVTEDVLSVTINDDPSIPAFTLNLDLFGKVRCDAFRRSRGLAHQKRNGVTPSEGQLRCGSSSPDTAFVSPNGLQMFTAHG